jgi:hypothetical protein
MIQTRRRKPAMEPMTMPAMAPPERVFASSGEEGSWLLLGVVPVIRVMVASLGLVVWRLVRRGRLRVRVGWGRVEAAVLRRWRVRAERVWRLARGGRGAMVVVCGGGGGGALGDGV